MDKFFFYPFFILFFIIICNFKNAILLKILLLINLINKKLEILYKFEKKKKNKNLMNGKKKL
jgi:hypothetical protein